MTKKCLISSLFLISTIILPVHLPYASAADEIVKCSRCLMKIENSTKKFSVTAYGRVVPVAFDDVSCAVLFREDLCARDQMEFDETARVHDYYTEEPVKITDAVYVIGSDIRTPMGSGIVSFKDRASAEKFIAGEDKGKIIRFETVRGMSFQDQEK